MLEDTKVAMSSRKSKKEKLKKSIRKINNNVVIETRFFQLKYIVIRRLTYWCSLALKSHHVSIVYILSCDYTV